MSAKFPVGSVVRIGSKPNPRSTPGSALHWFAYREVFVVIGDPWIVPGESELVDCTWVDGRPVEGTGRVVTHPDWVCYPLVERREVAEARDYFADRGTQGTRNDDESVRDYYGDDDRVLRVDERDIALNGSLGTCDDPECLCDGAKAARR